MKIGNYRKMGNVKINRCDMKKVEKTKKRREKLLKWSRICQDVLRFIGAEMTAQN